MAIHAGSNKPTGPRVDSATGDHGSAKTQFKGKDVLQFTQNFSVYLLPPDVVCLYSEDRKFFLHGELYCALAAAIGSGEELCADLLRELGKKYPADKIHEALKRLVERGYVIPKRRACHRHRRLLLGESRPAARDRGKKSAKMPRATFNRST